VIDQIHAMIADNVSSNDTQSVSLARRNNSYEEDNHVRCFNHTVQLSAKTLLAPFNPALSSSVPLDGVEENDLDLDEIPELEGVSDSEDEDTPGLDCEDGDDEEDSNDFTELTEEEREEILTKTAAVRETVTKV
jgi:hypothetical protein